VGFPTGGEYISQVAEDRMPEEVIKTITLLAAGGAARVFWYQLFDDRDYTDTTSTSSEDYFGLACFSPPAVPVITKKKGADAFALCGKYIPGTVYRPDLPLRSNDGGGIRAYCFQGPEQSALILWADTIEVSEAKAVMVTLPGTDQTRYDIETGASTVVSGETVTDNLGKAPLFLTWKPAAGSSPSVSTP
jgi:hypothetical protein